MRVPCWARLVVFSVWVLVLLVVLSTGCASRNQPNPNDLEAIECCAHPTEKKLCEFRCSPIPCSDPEGDGAWECDWSDEPCPDETKRKSKDCDNR